MYNLKKIVFALIIFFAVSIQAQAQFYNLVWADEFNGSTINSGNWTHEIGTGNSGWGNNELQFYTSRADNSQIINGQLAIIAKKETYSGSFYTSARMISKDKQSWKYGRLEARIKIPKQQGLWPAFWMLGTNFPSVGWPSCGEIDIMEHINTNNDIHGTIHWNANGYATYGGSTTITDVSQYHVYSIEWDQSKINWYIDGNQFWTANIANGINSTQEFHEPFFLILNMAVGGNWPGNPSNNFIKDTLWVDYVRVYQNQSAPTSLSEINIGEDLVLSPNPASADEEVKLQFSTSRTIDYKIINPNGQIVASKKKVSTNSAQAVYIDTKGFASGIYFLQVSDKEINYSRKILIR